MGAREFRTRQSGRNTTAGHAVLETALLAPWIFFLFVGVLDFGFYAYALIAVENATRAAALNAGIWGTNDQAAACRLVLDELSWMPNVKTLAPTHTCGTAPVRVQTASYTDTDGNLAARVTVTYETIPLIPIPGILMGKATISRAVDTKIYGG